MEAYANSMTARAANDQSGMDELTNDAAHMGSRIAVISGRRRIRHTAMTSSTHSTATPPSPKSNRADAHSAFTATGCPADGGYITAK